MPLVSVIIPVYNEGKYISDCLLSIINQDFQTDCLEIFCVDGMSTDNTRRHIREFSNQHNFIKLLDNPNKVVSHALNSGIKASTGDVIMRIDAHCVYPVNYISLLVKKLNDLKADNVGAVINSLPACGTAICKAIAVGSANGFGVGDSAFRIGSSKIKEVDTVPFGCFRRDIFEKIGYFDTDLIRNQDDEFNSRIIKNGGKVYLIPEVRVDYYARETIGKMARMFYQYALFKPLVNKKIGAPATVRQLVPPLFTTGIFGGIILSLLFPVVLPVFLFVLGIYCFISLVISLREALRHKYASLFFFLPVVFIVIHLSYGWGYLSGLVKFFFLKKKNVAVDVNH